MSVQATAPKKRNLSLNGDDVRRMCTAIAGGLVLAIMTGPEGSISEPTYGVKTSLLTSHVIGYLIFGVILGCLLTYRAKVQDGTWRRIRSTPRRTLFERAAAVSSISRYALLAVTALAAALVTLIFADFSGPVTRNKLSVHVLAHQFLYTRTYGYLLLALALWFTVVNQAMRLTTYRLRSIPRPLFVLGAVIAIFFFSLTSDPFLPARFAWRSLNPAVANSLFHHWTTYLWLILGLAISLSWLFKRDRSSGTGSPRRSRALVVTPPMRFLTYVAAGFIVFEAPKYMSQYWQISLFQQIGVFCLLAIGLNIVVGFAGLLDLGYVAFYCLGAYVTAYFCGALPLQPPFHLNPFLIIPFAIIIAMLSGVLLGLPTLRLRGDYLAIVTLGFGEIVYVLANDWTTVTGGSAGTGAITNFSIHLFGVNYAWNPTNPLSYYYLLLGILIPAIFLFDFLNHSKVGRTWAAIREDEVAAQSLGINALKYKVMAFAMGASTAGAAGVFTAVKVGHLFPNTFILQLSISILVLVIFGGMGSIVGVLLGAIVLQWLPSYMNFHSYLGFQEADLYLYIGALLVVMMIFRPQGLVPSRRRRREIFDAEEGLGSADALGAITQEQPS
ncbi:MAG TPA: branched-chain amino acid ABC transporter permease [Acidimicrobiales bacterium]|nr:branched-chain amino acid ABC transporter permease [Acidimicrobiales bacterium]